MLVSVMLSNGVKRWNERVLIADAPPGVAFGIWAKKKVKEAVRKFNTDRDQNQLRYKFSSKSIRILDATKQAKERTCETNGAEVQAPKPKRKGPPTVDELQTVSSILSDAVEFSRFCAAQLDSIRYKRFKGELTARKSRKALRNVWRCLRKAAKLVLKEIAECSKD